MHHVALRWTIQETPAVFIRQTLLAVAHQPRTPAHRVGEPLNKLGYGVTSINLPITMGSQTQPQQPAPNSEPKFVHPSQVPQEWEARICTKCTQDVKQTKAYQAFHLNIAGCRP